MRGNRAPHRRPTRCGAALLEALVALTILVVAAAAVVTGASDAAHAVGRAQAADHEMRGAHALMEAAALWPRADLDRHLGDRAQGPWRMRIDRETPTLYVVTIADTLSGAELIRTSLYRPEDHRGAP